MNAIATIRDLSPKRRLLAAFLALSLVGTGIASWAAISDTLVTTSNYAVTAVDLHGGSDGTTYANTATLDWNLEGTTQVNRILYLKNTGNTSLSFQAGYQSSDMVHQPGSISWTATGSADITGAKFEIRSITAPGQCPGSGTVAGSQFFSSATTVATKVNLGPLATNPNPVISIAPAGTAMLCLSTKPTASPAAGSTATQTLSIIASGGL